MKATLNRIACRGCAAVLFFAAALLSAQQSAPIVGSWHMDTAKSHVNDGRVVNLTIASGPNMVSLTMKTKVGQQAEVVSQFTNKLDGKASDYMEGTHKSSVMVWFNGPALNVSKEKGPPEDVTSMWTLTPSSDGQTLTMVINHYEPTAADETLVFTKGAPVTP
jgi:hypothetical protein